MTEPLEVVAKAIYC